MKKETPSALMSGAIRGAFRSGRYAKRSIATPSTPHPTIAPRIISRMSNQTATLGSCAPPEPGDDPPADERTHHEHVAVREVEQLQDPVDHREPERDERVHAPERQPVDGSWTSLSQSTGRLSHR